MFFPPWFSALIDVLYITFFFLIEFIISLLNQDFDFSVNSALVCFCIGA